MEKKKLLACHKCHLFYSEDQSSLDYSCDKCGGALTLVPVRHNEYMHLSEADKEQFKQKYFSQSVTVKKDVSVAPFVPMPQSSWVSYIGCFGWIALVLFVLAGILTLMSGLIVYGIVLILAGLASSGFFILFSIVAEDVRHIRNQVDRYYHGKK